MAPNSRIRRTVQEESEESEDDPRQSTQARRGAPASDEESQEEAEEEDEDMDDADTDGQDQTVKKLVRYALACEYKRTKITRAGISEKVIGKQRGGAFKKAFEGAQRELRTKFGMEMVVLPAKVKVTMKEKRAAQKNQGKSNTMTTWILTTILPPEYRIPEIMPPSIIGSAEEEAAYIGICTVIVSIISMSPDGTIPDHRLDSYLKRFNLEKNTGFGTTADLMKKMVVQGYLVKSKSSNETEETVEWMVGPRGKVEIGNRGVQGLVQEVYGEDAPEDLDRRLQRSLGMEVKKVSQGNEEAEPEPAVANGDPGPSNGRGQGRGQGRRKIRAADNDDDDDDDD